MKKYSKYNVYRDLHTMITFKEAIAEIKAGNINSDNLHKLQARLELYQSIFNGFSNTEEEKKEFERRVSNFLGSFSDSEIEEYETNVKKEVEKNYDDAISEFLNRTGNINMNSTDGKADGVPAYESSHLEECKSKYLKTRFSKLHNLPIGKEYRSNDDGVFVYDKTKYDYVRVCDPLIIKALAFDNSTSTQYIILEYYDYNRNGTVATICIPAEELAQGKYSVLHALGIVVDNNKLLTKYFNDLRSTDNKTKSIERCEAATHYGYPQDENGDLVYDKFIGIGNEKIIPIKEYTAYDKAIFNKKGSLEGFIDFLSEVSKGKYQINFQLVVAASLASIVQAYVSGTSNILAPPCYIFTEKSSTGKGILAAIANNIWGAPSRKNLIASSDSSTTFYNAFKQHLAYIPLIVGDIQDLIDKEGLSAVIQMIFEHANGVSGGRGTNTGEVRENLRFWYNCLMCFGEKDYFSGSLKLTGGADARIVTIPLNLEKDDKWITEKNPKSYISLENRNYGHLGEAFVLKMREKTQEEITDRFFEITQELETLGVQEKQGNALALLVQTSELLKEFNLVPERWQPIDSISLTDWIDIKMLTDPALEVYKMLSEIAFKDKSYVPNDDKYFIVDAPRLGLTEKDIFDARMKNSEEIRGRILYQKKNASGIFEECKKEAHERALLLIPKLQLTQLFNYIIKESGIVGFGFDKRMWERNGWLIKSKDGYTHRDTFHISVTRPRNENREHYYALVLYEDKEATLVPEEIAYMNECLEQEKKSVDSRLWGSRCERCTDERCEKNKKK